MAGWIAAQVLRRVLLPTVVAAALLAGFVGVVLVAATSRSDALALERQTRLISSALEQAKDKVANDQEASTLWDDAVLQLHRPSLDMDWLDNNLGVWFHTYYRHDETYVLDPRLTPVYAMQAGKRASPQAFAHAAPQVLPLARGLKKQLADGYWAEVEDAEQTIGARDVDLVDHRPAIVSLKPIVPESDEAEQAPGSEFIHVSIRYLDSDFLTDLSQRLEVEDPAFRWTSDGAASVPIANSAGVAVGYLSWRPFNPGDQVAQHMAPALILAILTVSGLIASLLLLLRRGRAALESSRAQAEHLAFHDVLTGLANRAMFDKRLASAAMRANASSSLAVLIIDLDRFKNVNDTLGHQAGDALIREVAHRLTSIFRDCDTVARLGGDEFAIILENVSREDLERFCQRILRAVSKPFELRRSQAFVGASIGVASVTGRVEDSADLVRKADIALYEVKASGRQHFRIFSEDMDENVRWRGSIEDELRKSLGTGEGLAVHYQPLVNGADGRIVAVEALVRWHHPQLGIVSPDRFIPVAEETGLISTLGNWVLHEAARDSLRWPDLRMAVNLAPPELRSADFYQRALHIVTSAGADPSMFELEVTERVLLDDDQSVRDTLAKLRRAGFSIVLDDFGTGYSSLSYLQKFEVDKIKVDRSFIRNLGQDDGSAQIVKAILALGRAMGLTVSAEGVETPEQLQLLLDAGCTQMQGFLFAKGLSATELDRMVNPAGQVPRAAAG